MKEKLTPPQPPKEQPPAAESKRERFIRMAERRVNNLLGSIALIGNLSSRNNYEYTKDDVSQIFREIRDEVTKAEKRFLENTRGKEKFKLKDRNNKT